MMKYKYNKVLLILFLVFSFSCKENIYKKNYIEKGIDNSSESRSKAIVILISLDGFRYDYRQKYNTPTLDKLQKKGSYAKSLIPVFPSKTFPNHISIITGLLPANSGIVSNSFYDPQKKIFYIYYNSKISAQSHWYKGQSLWSVCMENKLRSAAIFWPGSEAKIGKYRPGFYMTYDASVSAEKKIETLIHLLKLPEKRKPHFITLYFHQPDSVGHRFGPNSKQTGKVVSMLDKNIALLMEKLQDEKIKANIVIVSDHGMEEVDSSKVINLNKLANLKKFIVAGHGSHVFLYAKAKKGKHKLIRKTIAKLRKNKNIRVYKRQKSPLRWGFRNSILAGDIIVEAIIPYYVRLTDGDLRHKGYHGWDPKDSKNMHGIFIAIGPDIRSGIELSSFPNIDVYPFILNLLGLAIPKNIDSDKERLKILLKKN